MVLSPDRLARNYVHQMVLIEEFEKGGCRVEFVERPMSSEPNDQLLLQIRGAVAEYERTLLSERMRRGRLAKYKAGLLPPWTHVPDASPGQDHRERQTVVDQEVALGTRATAVYGVGTGFLPPFSPERRQSPTTP